MGWPGVFSACPSLEGARLASDFFSGELKKVLDFWQRSPDTEGVPRMMRRGECHMKVFQDGRHFWVEKPDKSEGEDYLPSDPIFSSSLVVSDHDMHAARLAREEFLDWAAREGLEVDFDY